MRRFVSISQIAIASLLACADESNPEPMDGSASGASSSTDATTEVASTDAESTTLGPEASTTQYVSSTEEGSTSSSSTDDGADTDASSTGAAACSGADETLVMSAWVECDLPGYLGQIGEVTGVTCEQVCCVFGYAGCIHRAAQIGLDGCADEIPMQTGSCADVFEQGWSSHCLCE